MLKSALQPLLAASVFISLAGGCSPSRTGDAVGLLADIARQDPPAAVPRETIAYATGQGTSRADLYAPSEIRAGLVLVPGAAEDAMDDPRLINFADALRRRGFCVLVPELAGADFLQVSARDADAIADAAGYLLASTGLDEVGLAALSHAVGPTIQAALRPDVSPDIGFIVAIGGYHDVIAGITYLTTGAFRAEPGQPWRHAAVDSRAKWRFLRANTDWVSDPAEARALEAIARAWLRGDGAEVSALAARLGPEGRAVYAVLVNEDPERVPRLIADLPPRIRQEIKALDLAGLNLGRLDADLILVHGLDDPLVPHTESLGLARAVGPEQASVYLLNNLQHVDLADPGAGDLVTLLRVAYRVLSERDAIMMPAQEENPQPRVIRAQDGAGAGLGACAR